MANLGLAVIFICLSVSQATSLKRMVVESVCLGIALIVICWYLLESAKMATPTAGLSLFILIGGLVLAVVAAVCGWFRGIALAEQRARATADARMSRKTYGAVAATHYALFFVLAGHLAFAGTIQWLTNQTKAPNMPLSVLYLTALAALCAGLALLAGFSKTSVSEVSQAKAEIQP